MRTAVLCECQGKDVPDERTLAGHLLSSVMNSLPLFFDQSDLSVQMRVVPEQMFFNNSAVLPAGKRGDTDRELFAGRFKHSAIRQGDGLNPFTCRDTDTRSPLTVTESDDVFRDLPIELLEEELLSLIHI